MKRWALLLVALATLALLALAALRVGRRLVETNPGVARLAGGRLPVRVAPARTVDGNELFGASGVVTPLHSLTLTSGEGAARVATVDVEVGDRVSSGQVLLTLDAELLRAALESAQATLARATADAERATKQLARQRSLSAQGRAVLELEAAEAAAQAAEARRAEGRERLLRAQADLGNATRVAPGAGVVTERLVWPGELTLPGQKLLVVALTEPVLVEVRVGEDRLLSLASATAATLTFDSLPGRQMKGEVYRVDPLADPVTRTLTVLVRLLDPDPRLRLGLTAFVRFASAERAMLAVPSVAVLSPAGLGDSAVFVVSDGRAWTRPVQIGTIAQGMTEILQGLREGEEVVTVGHFHLRDGDRVRIGDELGELRQTPSPKGETGPPPASR